jgi:hypothetical protein
MLKLDAATLWNAAIERWHAGDSQGVVDLLAGDRDLPAFARAFLARVAAGTEKSDRRLKTKEPTVRTIVHEHLVRERFKELWAVEKKRPRPKDGSRTDTPKDRALEALEAEFDMSADAISRIVFPRKPRKYKPRKKKR